MSTIFSRQCEYALQAVLYLALKSNGEMTSIRELTRKLDLPYHFIAKILQDLTRKGLLRSQKGCRGGFTLGIPVEDITLFHIVEAIDGSEFMNNCVLGFPECSKKNPCAVHNQWSKLRDGIYMMLISKNISDMSDSMKKPQFCVFK